MLGAAVLAGCAAAPGAPKPEVLRAVAPVVPTVAQYSTAAVHAAPSSPAPTYLTAGVHEHQVELDGQVRRWTTVVPPTAEGSRPSALVVVLHGVGGNGADMRSKGFDPLAAERGVVMAYPDAFGGAWNDGRPGTDPVVPGVTVDDSRFLRLLIEETTSRTGADIRHVAVVGLSNGAMMAARVACDLADQVSAVALVVGSAGQGFEQTCRPVRPVAVMVVAGSDDATVPYGGGRVADWQGKRRGYVAGVDAFVDFWRAQNGCASTQVVPGPPTVGVASAVGCRTGGAVLRYRVEGGGHDWYQPPKFDTTAAIWDFTAQRFSVSA